MSKAKRLHPDPTSAALNPAGISDGDRLGMTFFLALILHAILILGVTFSLSPQANENPPALDIILVQTSQPSPVEDAKFLAQVSQQGGGDSEQNIRPQDLFTAPTLAEQPGMALQTAQAEQAQRQTVEQQQILLNQTSSHQTRSDPRSDSNNPEHNTQQHNSQQAMQVARLAQEINNRIETGARSDKVKYLNSSTREFTPAQYMRQWINRVERIGNLNYPDQARREKLSGTLILDVVVNARGELIKTDLRRSSGHKVLDDAARRIVQLAAPFAPFPAKLKAEADVIHITRSWEFLSTNRLTTH